MHLKPFLSTLSLLSLLLFPLLSISLASAGPIPHNALLHASHLQPQVHAHLQSHHGQHPPLLPVHLAHNSPPHKAPHCPPSPCLSAFMANEASARNLCSAFTVSPALPKRLDWMAPCVDESGGSIIETLTGACACLESGEDDLDYGAGANHDL